MTHDQIIKRHFVGGPFDGKIDYKYLRPGEDLVYVGAGPIGPIGAYLKTSDSEGMAIFSWYPYKDFLDAPL